MNTPKFRIYADGKFYPINLAAMRAAWSMEAKGIVKASTIEGSFFGRRVYSLNVKA